MQRTALTAVLVVLLPLSQANAQQPTKPLDAVSDRDTNLQAYVELLRSDVRSQKIAVLTQLMAMDDKQDETFWPLYRQYELELTKLNDERVSLIREYATAYPDISDSVADRVIMQALSVDGRRSGLLAKYYAVVKAALGVKLAAQFVQIEHQLLTLIDLQIAATLPIIK